jgi:hypothetical protein
MKIGLSFSRCVRDIWEGRVDSHDVLVIIARTNFNPNDDAQWEGIWQGYHHGGVWNHPEWQGIDNEEEFRHLCMELYNSGLIHQPRQFGTHPTRRSEIWLEAVLPNEELEKNPMAKKAWNNFQTIAGLTSVELDKEYR